eukprot:2315932-Amphidinium_carterae.1
MLYLLEMDGQQTLGLAMHVHIYVRIERTRCICARFVIQILCLTNHACVSLLIALARNIAPCGC